MITDLAQPLLGMAHWSLGSLQGKKNPDGVVMVRGERGRYGRSVDGLGCLLGDQEVHQLKRQLLRVKVMGCGGGTDGVGLNSRQLVQDGHQSLSHLWTCVSTAKRSATILWDFPGHLRGSGLLACGQVREVTGARPPDAALEGPE